MFSFFRRKRENENIEDKNEDNEMEFEYHNYYPVYISKDVVENFITADRLLVKNYGDKYALYTSRDIATGFITKAQQISLILSSRIERNLRMATQYTADEIDMNPNFLTDHLFLEDVALIRSSKSVDGKLAELALQHHQVYVQKIQAENKKRWRWF